MIEEKLYNLGVLSSMESYRIVRILKANQVQIDI